VDHADGSRSSVDSQPAPAPPAGACHSPGCRRAHGVVRSGMSQQDPIPSRKFVYAAVFEPAEEGGCVVTFPAIADLATQGANAGRSPRHGRGLPPLLPGRAS
jgi:hypothetical protein